MTKIRQSADPGVDTNYLEIRSDLTRRMMIKNYRWLREDGSSARQARSVIWHMVWLGWLYHDEIAMECHDGGRIER